MNDQCWESAMNMSSGLDIEETMKNLMNPDTWITKWFTAAFEVGKGDWAAMAQDAQPLPNESAGERFRYSGANTMMLVLATEHVTGMRW